MLSPIDPGVAKHTGESPRGRRGINCLKVDPASIQYPISNIQGKVERSCEVRKDTSIQYPIDNSQVELRRICQEIARPIIHTHLLIPHFLLSHCLTVLHILRSPKPLNGNAIPFKVRRRLTLSRSFGCRSQRKEFHSFVGRRRLTLSRSW